MEANHQLTKEQQQEVERQLSIIRRGAAEIIPEDALTHKIATSVLTGKPLKVKLGLYPSSPDIHVGHTVVLQKLRQFQDLGHEVQLIIGDFTGRIGDPTGKSETRKQLSEDDVKRNAATYEKQVYKILDPKRTKFYFNSAWLEKMNFQDVMQLGANVTVARMLERDDFSKRYKSNQPIHIHEFFYPLMQGYDSVALESDIEIGGTDQTFNILMGRTLQGTFGRKDSQVAVLMPLMEGLDGIQKMSKSLGNYIGIDESPNEMFGKTMSIPDELMVKYFELSTPITNDELLKLKQDLHSGDLHPRDAKIQLAKYYVRMFHSEQAAEQAKEHFITLFQKRLIPENIDERHVSNELLEQGRISISKLLIELGFVSSNSEAKRSVVQGAVKINGSKILDPFDQVKVYNGDIIQSGKRKFAKLVIAEHIDTKQM
ncbi:tyrosine--tRNA ligase [Paenibacillus sp. Marseille-Q7038]